MPDLERAGTAAVGISPDKPEKQKKFADKYGLGFPLLADENREIAEAFGAIRGPIIPGTNIGKIVRSAFLIDEDQKIAEAWYNIKANDTVPKAMAALAL